MASIPAWRRSGVPLGPYMGKAVGLTLGRSIAAWSSAVSAPRHRRWGIGSRPQNLRPAVDGNAAALRPCPEPQVAQADLAGKLRREIDRVAAELDAIDRRVVAILRTSDNDAASIAKTTGLPATTVYRARKRFILKAR